MKILVLDNYDSFTFNLVQYIQEILRREVDVFRNDAITLEAVAAYDVIILSPGPGIPEQAGIMPALIKQYASEKMILGVCLGHQAIGEAFGAGLENLKKVYHGVSTLVQVIDKEDVLMQHMPGQFEAGRYHSWVVDKNNCPDILKITAKDIQGEIMAFKHQEFDVWGLQFHPESIMTVQGKDLLKNFLNYCSQKLQAPAASLG